MQSGGIFKATSSTAGNNVGLKAARHCKRSRRGPRARVKAARGRILEGYVCAWVACLTDMLSAVKSMRWLDKTPTPWSMQSERHAEDQYIRLGTAGSSGTTVQCVRRSIAASAAVGAVEDVKTNAKVVVAIVGGEGLQY